MTLQLDDVDPAARTKRILVLTAGDGPTADGHPGRRPRHCAVAATDKQAPDDFGFGLLSKRKLRPGQALARARQLDRPATR